MADYITLLGAEQVQSAGSQMRSAADTMMSAAANLAGALDGHMRQLDDLLSRHAQAMDVWLDQFRGALERFNPPELLKVVDPQLDPTLCNKTVEGETCVLEPGHRGPCDWIPF